MTELLHSEVACLEGDNLIVSEARKGCVQNVAIHRDALPTY